MLINRGFSDVNPLVAGYEACEPEHFYGPCARDYYVIHYVVSGMGVFKTGDKSYSLTAGEMFLFSPRETIFYQADKEKPWTYIWIGFTTSFDVTEIFNRHVISARECGTIFSEITECERFEQFRELYLCGKIFEILAYLDKKLLHIDEPVNQYVLMAKNYIETNYQKKITVDMMAKALNLDRSYFSTIFKKQTGKSPQRYLIDYRLEKAAQDMLVYGCTPTDAALGCGYADIFNFSRMFKRKFGMSPQHYKAAVQKKQLKTESAMPNEIGESYGKDKNR